MSNGNRGDGTAHLGYGGYTLALVLSCLIIAGLSYSQGRESERRYKAPQQHAESAKTYAQRACVGLEPTAAFECIIDAVETSSETARAEQDLDAQQWMAFWALLMVIVSTIMAVVTGIGIYYVKQTLDATLTAVDETGKATKAMLDANEIADETAKRQLRAYMGINKYDLTPYEIGVVGTGRFMVAMQNFGQTPAIALTTQVSYAITEWVDRDTRPEAWNFESDRFPIDVAPGAPMFREIYFSEHAAAHLVELQTGASALWVKFHAVYDDIFGRRHEQTTLFYSRRSSYLSGDMLPIDQTREITTGP